MTVSQQGKIDFTIMYSTHDAFRRDLERLIAAAAAGKSGTPEVHAGWKNFKTQLHIHHTVEDDDLWPPLRNAVQDRPGDLALVDEMEAEHAQINPLLAAVDDALAGERTGLTDRAHELSVALTEHLEHEEDSALPLIQSVLTPKHWRDFRGAMARRQGLKGAAVYVPWILDGTQPAKRQQFLRAMPPPVRVLNKLAWQRRYQRRHLWNH